MVNPFSGACGFVALGCPVDEVTYVIAASVTLSDFRRRVCASDTPNACPSVFPKRCGPCLIKSLLYLPKAYNMDGLDPGFELQSASIGISKPDGQTIKPPASRRKERNSQIGLAISGGPPRGAT